MRVFHLIRDLLRSSTVQLKCGGRRVTDMLDTKQINCPYCWESIEILVDPSVDEQDYIEDCEVCCRPIRFLVRVVGDDIYVDALHEDE